MTDTAIASTADPGTPDTVGGLGIGTKLNLGFGVLVALALMVIGISYFSSNRAEVNMRRTTEVRAPTALASARAQAELLRMVADVRGYLALGDESYRDGYREASRLFESNLSRLEQQMPEQILASDHRLVELRRSYAQWSKLPDQLFDLHDDQLAREPALRLLIREANPLIARILVNVKGILTTQKRQQPTRANMNLLAEMADFQASFFAMVSGLRGYVTTARESFKFEYSTNLAINQAAGDRLAQSESRLTGSQRGRLEKMIAAREAFAPLPQRIFDIVESERAREDLYLFRSKAVPVAETMLDRLGQVTGSEIELLEQELSQAVADLDSMKTQIQAVGVLALMLGAALAFVMRRNIVAPIRRLTGVARRVGSGDLDARAPIESRDEIGVLARTFNAMTEHLNATLEDLERRRREQQTSAETLAALHETTLGLISRLQLSDLLEALVERAGHLLGTPHGYIYLQDESASEIQRRIGVGVFSESVGFPLKPGEGVAGQVWSSGEPLVVNDYASWEGRPDSTSYDVDVRSIIGVPLNSRGRTVGVLGMAYDADSGQAFSTAEVKILDRFAQLASLSLDNAYLYEEARVARDEAQQALEQLRLAQESLLHSEKLASLGQLTAGIAHEIKNPLNFVNNFAEVSGELLAELNDTIGPALTAMPADVRDEAEDLLQTLSGNLGKINEHGARADSIVKGMLSHAREGEDVARAADLNALLEESLNLAYHGARAENADFNVTLETELSDAVGEVEIHPQEVMRVFLNLIGNGFHATHKRRLAGDEPDYAPTLKLSSHDRGDEVEVRVRDNGTGMPREVAERVFEPFFTTKPPGQGTGLGLSISYDIVTKQHHGRLEVHSKAGEYTEFRVTFPRHVGGASGAQ